MSTERVLLPSAVTPSKYDLLLKPDLKNFTFDGEVKIHVDVSEETKTVSLHAKELYIKDATYTSNDGSQTLKAEQINNDVKLTVTTFVFGDTIAQGAGKITINYSGFINDKMAGFYRCKYKDADGNMKYMASTQFEALDARRALPCWDEPAQKAVFGLTMELDATLTVLSNMPEAYSTISKGGKKTVCFDDTPKMSTYLLAFCIGEFDYVQKFTKDRVAVRVYTPPGKREEGYFSLDVAVKTLEFYDDYFDVRYPLPKLDMIAITEFAMGAMENWGLITYREVDVLINADKASAQQKQRVCTVVTHEIAHQWFGNLVTMEWWDNLWLNEGFASWMQNFAADHIFPKWKIWEQFTVDDMHSAMGLDELETSHPIQVPIKHAEEVEQVFDAISYYKGACVVRILHAVLGKDHFRDGLRLYFKRHSYGNTITADLWQAWKDVSGKDIPALMANWTQKMGYPIVRCTEVASANGTATLSIRQSRFLADGSEAKEKTVWTVPLQIEGVDGKSKSVLMTDAETKIDVAAANVNVNSGKHGLFRVCYEGELFDKQLSAVSSKTVCAEDRASLVDDTAAIAQAGLIDVSQVLKAIAAAGNKENSYIVWECIETSLAALNKSFTGLKFHSAFKAFAAKLTAKLCADAGWESRATDGHLDSLARAIFLRMQARYSEGNDALLTEAKRRFNIYVADPSNIKVLPSDIILPVFKLILRESDSAKEYEMLMDLYSRLDSTIERNNVMQALGSSKDAKLKLRTLHWAVDEVKLQDFFYPIIGVSSSSPEGAAIAWDFFKTNFAKIKAKVGNASPSLMNAAVVYSCYGLTSAKDIDEIEAFFKENPLPQNTRGISQMLEKKRAMAKFAEKVKSSPINDPSFWDTL